MENVHHHLINAGRGYRWRYTAMTALYVILFCVATHVTFFLLWRALTDDSAARSFLFDEDRLVETLSAAMFLCAGIYATRLWWMASESPSLDRLALAFIAALSLVGFLDEISFGERIIHFDVYKIVGIRIDGVHDLIEVANELRREWFGPMDFVEKVFLVALACSLIVLAAAPLCQGSCRLL
jgi:hypothetical protein